jgi:excisionase family DNA binding protein
MTTPETEFLTVAEVAERLRVSGPTVYREIHAGQIPAVRLGSGASTLRVPRAELEVWLFGEPPSAAQAAAGRTLGIPAEVIGAAPQGSPTDAPATSRVEAVERQALAGREGRRVA